MNISWHFFFPAASTTPWQLDAASENWRFDGPFKEMTFASKDQHRIYWGPLKKPGSLKTWLAGGGGDLRGDPP